MKEKIARQLITERGIFAELYCGKCVRKGGDDGRDVSVKVLYLGPDADGNRDIHVENDRYVYTNLRSPFPEEPGYYNALGLFRDEKNDLWAEQYAMAFLKDPELYEKGIRLTVYVPEELAELRPRLRFRCNGKELAKKVLDTAGIIDIRAGIRDVDEALTGYISETRRLQMKLLDELKRVCEKYGLKYYLICGGLIGIMRSGDFIPWDDDIDIAMTREDHDILNDAAEREWPEGSDFLWLTPEKTGDDAFLDFMTRLVYMKEKAPADVFERLGDRGRKDIHYRMPMDIYILENAPRSETEHKKLVGKLQRLYVLSMGRRGGFDTASHSDMGRLKLAAARLAMKAGRLVSKKRLMKKYHKYASKYKDSDTGLYYQSNGYYACMDLRFEKKIFGEGKEVKAGDTRVRVPDDGGRFLEIMYGNYRDYPILYDRHPMHGKDVPDGYPGADR
ncbi:MAG: LicD family protein [Lachnospiraceae bacterium]|nr:LicD family protein [Lachnospiraceae bacterium]